MTVITVVVAIIITIITMITTITIIKQVVSNGYASGLYSRGDRFVP
jgi:hypothetical protein